MILSYHCGVEKKGDPAGHLKNESPRRSTQDGFVLVAMLGALALLAIVASTLMLYARSQIKARASLNAHAELVALADGITNLSALLPLASANVGDRKGTIPVDGTPMRCRDGEVLVEIRINDTSGLIDINMASMEVLEMLLSGLGVPRPEAARLAAAIKDFRDPDNEPEVGGAESPDYLNAGRPYGPKNASFDTIDELDQVLGMTPELLARLRPLVTAHSGLPGITAAAAPMALLQALARGEGRDEPSVREQFKLPAQLSFRASLRSPTRRRNFAFALRVTAARRDGAQFTRFAVIEPSSQADLGFIVRAWAMEPAHLLPRTVWQQIEARCETSR